MIRHELLARAFVELADTLVDDFEITDFLHVLTDVSVQVLDADAAGLLLANQRGELRLTASTGNAEALESYELRTGEGPCVDCFATGRAVVNIDAETARLRWPGFARLGAELGFNTFHAFPMRLRQQVIGALNIYSVRPDVLAASELDVTQALADVATIGLMQERMIGDQSILTEQLQGALTTRVLIEQAKGMLAERTGLAVPQAFSVMRGYARKHGVTLRSIASGIVDGTLPTAGWDRPRG